MPLPTADLQHILAHTSRVWPAVRGKRLFLTGGSGFFGRWLLESYLAASDAYGLGGEVVALTRDASALAAKAPKLVAHPALRLHRGQQRDFAFPEGSFDLVIHAAVEYGSAKTILESNLLGTQRVLSLAAERGTSAVLLTSSGAVYGRQPPELSHLPEDFAGAPDCSALASAYGEQKRASELLGIAYGQEHGFACKIARGFAFVGPHLLLDQGSAIGNFMGDALHGGPVRIGGDGTPVRSYLYAADLAIWLWTILVQGQHGRPYNVGSDVALDLAHVAARVAAHAEPTTTVTIAKTPTPGTLAERYVPLVTRARDELGLTPLIDLDSAIARTLAWHRSRAKDAA